MLNLKWIRENQDKCKEVLALRGIAGDVIDKLIILYQEQKHITNLMQQLQQARNEKLKNFSAARSNGRKMEEIKKDLEHIKDKLHELDGKLHGMNAVNEILDSLPNLPSFDVPIGSSEADNKIIKEHGIIRQIEDARQHFEIGTELKMMDFKQTAKISGSRFATLSGGLARMERALINFMLDIHTKKFHFVETSPPYLVKDEAMYFVGQLPKFAAESFVTTNNYRLIPTSEVSLVAMHADTIIPEENFPLRMVAATPCYRSEAGSAGRDTKGMIRLHQFHKVELVSIVPQEDSENEHQFILNAAETILQTLELPYRVALLCTQDMGFAAQKTYDLEVWMPGQNKYREISSCSNCGEFQARRAKIRYRKIGSNISQFAHTLNGSGLAIGRTIAAIIENYQNKDGSISIPPALVPYMDGVDLLKG
jgi:seryl-tRNA synthetase